MNKKKQKGIKSTLAFVYAVTVMAANAMSISASANTAESIDDLLGGGENTDTEVNKATDALKALLGAASDYNVFVRDDFYVGGADCTGNLAVGGNAYVQTA